VPTSFAGVASSVHIPDDLENYKSAMQSPEAAHWQKAMQAEYDSLMQTGTWRLISLPAGRKVVRCKWIYRIKTNSDGSIARYKARLVAQGSTQIAGVDYDQTFSLVVKYDSIQTTLAIAAQQKMHITQFDIQTAFLHGLIDTIIYMLQPLGFEIASDNGAVMVCMSHP
jgi:hypothetical protein